MNAWERIERAVEPALRTWQLSREPLAAGVEAVAGEVLETVKGMSDAELSDLAGRAVATVVDAPA